MKNLGLVCVMTALFLMMVVGGHSEETPIDQLIPDNIDGWKCDGFADVYDRDTLYDYINGAAEVYFAYDFREAFARRFEKEGRPGITADVFDMGNSQDAYGIFSFEREDEDAGIGQDSEYAAGFLRFWKGRFFVSILADRETPESREVVQKLGRLIASKVEPGERPEMLALVPKEKLMPTSVRYFHEQSGLSYHYYLAHENILHLGKETDVILARYQGEDSARYRLLLVNYPGEDEAKKAYADFKAAYMPEAGEGSVIRTEDEKWVRAIVRKNLFIGVFESPTKEVAGKLIESVVKKAKEKEDEERKADDNSS